MFDATGTSLITAAAVFAAEAHAGQVRKELNEPYIVHPLRVGKLAAHLGQTPEFIAAAYLHDVVEDTMIPMPAVERMFPDETAQLVRALTKWWESGLPVMVMAANKQAYYDHILATPGAVLLKVLDRIDNLYDFAKMARRGAPNSHKWAEKYSEKTVEEFAPLLTYLKNTGQVAETTAVMWFDAALMALSVAL